MEKIKSYLDKAVEVLTPYAVVLDAAIIVLLILNILA